MNLQLSDREFNKIRELLYNVAGISLSEQKRTLVISRLWKRLNALKLKSFEEYYKYLTSPEGEKELSIFIDRLTTNTTYFFREDHHFEFIKNVIIPENSYKKSLRIWSAGCSSGEEPYTIAIVLKENIDNFNQWNIKILATDISVEMLSKAKRGIYHERSFEKTPNSIKMKYFTKTKEGLYMINEDIKRLVTFRILNLKKMDTLKFKSPLDVIFCRNTMIYFDNKVKTYIVNKFYSYLRKDGYLIIGHSESLQGIESPFVFIQPTIYKRVE